MDILGCLIMVAFGAAGILSLFPDQGRVVLKFSIVPGSPVYKALHSQPE